MSACPPHTVVLPTGSSPPRCFWALREAALCVLPVEPVSSCRCLDGLCRSWTQHQGTGTQRWSRSLLGPTRSSLRAAASPSSDRATFFYPSGILRVPPSALPRISCSSTPGNSAVRGFPSSLRSPHPRVLRPLPKINVTSSPWQSAPVIFPSLLNSFRSASLDDPGCVTRVLSRLSLHPSACFLLQAPSSPTPPSASCLCGFLSCLSLLSRLFPSPHSCLHPQSRSPQSTKAPTASLHPPAPTLNKAPVHTPPNRLLLRLKLNQVLLPIAGSLRASPRPPHPIPGPQPASRDPTGGTHKGRGFRDAVGHKRLLNTENKLRVDGGWRGGGNG